LGSVRQDPSQCEYGGGFLPGTEGRDPGRRQEAELVGAYALDAAPKPGELDGKEARKEESMAQERCVPGMAYDLRLVLQGIYGWKDAAEGSETFQKLVCVGLGDGEIDRAVARTNGPSCPDGRGSLGRNASLLDSKSDDRFYGGAQQAVLSREAQDPRVSDGGIYDHYAFLRRRETHPTVPLTNWKWRGTDLMSFTITTQ
jgi:hypothetical protein